jgi:hypothetical protein
LSLEHPLVAADEPLKTHLADAIRRFKESSAMIRRLFRQAANPVPRDPRPPVGHRSAHD